MSEKKKIRNRFFLYDRSRMIRFLEEQALNGWMLEDYQNGRWYFRRCEPKKVHYSVNYFPDSSGLDPELSENHQLFLEYCEHSGWNSIVSSGPMQVFSSDLADPVPISTDLMLEIETIHKVMKKNHLVTWICSILTIGISIAAIIVPFILSPVHFLAGANKSTVLCLAWIASGLGALTELCLYYSWRKKAIQMVQITGEFAEAKRKPLFYYLLAFLSPILMTYGAFSFFNGSVLIIIGVVLTGVFGVLSMSNLMRELKESGVSAKKNAWISISAVIALIAVASPLLLGFASQLDPDVLAESKLSGTYHVDGKKYYIYADEIPLKVEDLTETAYESYSYKRMVTAESPFLKVYQAKQEPKTNDTQYPELRYRIYTLKAEFLYDWCLNEIMQEYDSYLIEDSAAFMGIEQVYRLHSDSDARPYGWLLCNGNMIVEIFMGWEPTAEQFAIIVEKLL